ncbi:hypothetical protein KSS87_019061 [Heliosperma pusillum]|nr:hypothetical protein KSS87_019061 [Heliosperma pusillum]
MRPPRGGGSFRGRGGDRGGRGFGGGRGGGRGFGGRGGGGGGFRDEGPPSEVTEISTFVHACEGEAVTKLTNEKVPYFNAPIYLQNMTQIGKVEEIFGPINESFFSVKMKEGIVATSYSPGDKFYIDPAKLLPLARFLPQPKLKIEINQNISYYISSCSVLILHLGGQHKLEEVVVVGVDLEEEVVVVVAVEVVSEEGELQDVEEVVHQGGAVVLEGAEEEDFKGRERNGWWCAFDSPKTLIINHRASRTLLLYQYKLEKRWMLFM